VNRTPDRGPIAGAPANVGDVRVVPAVTSPAAGRMGRAALSPGRLWALLCIAMGGVTAHKTRTLLTLLGVVIGVAAVISAAAVSAGAAAQVDAQIDRLGANLVWIQPGSAASRGVREGLGTANTLAASDAAALTAQATPNGAAPDVALVAPEDTVAVQAVYGRGNVAAAAIGVTPDYLAARDAVVSYGRFIGPDDVRRATKVCIVGAALVDALFAQRAATTIGAGVLLNGQLYRVIGVMAAKGDLARDNSLFVPITAVQRRLAFRAGAAPLLTGVNVVAAGHDRQDAAQAEVSYLLRRLHRLRDDQGDDFVAQSQTSVRRAATIVTGLLTGLLGSISLVSLLVGGIGIMNIMLVTVTERTREIGLRKAVGARRADILVQFLAESTLISALGGAGGIVLGCAIAWIVPLLTAGAATVTLGEFGPASLHPVISPGSVVLAVGVSVAVGLFFGGYPAARAARLDPIQALRHE